MNGIGCLNLPVRAHFGAPVGVILLKAGGYHKEVDCGKRIFKKRNQ
jgi:hypothetical protein